MVKIRTFLSLLTLLIGISVCHSQHTQTIDSIWKALNATHQIGDKIDLYLLLTNEYKNINLDTSLILASKALGLAEQGGSDDRLGSIYRSLGELTNLQDSMDASEAYYMKAAQFAEQNENWPLKIRVYLALGNRNIEIDNFPEAMDYYQQAITISNEIGNSAFLPHLYNNMGIIYLRTKKYPEALAIQGKAMTLFQRVNDSSNIAGLYANMGSTYSEMGNYKIAGEYYRKALEMFRSLDNHEGMAHALMKLGILSQTRGICDSSLYYLYQSLEIHKTLDVTLSGSRSIFEAEIHINMGICDRKMGRVSKAISELYYGYELALQSRQFSLITEASNQLSLAYEQLNQPDKALIYAKVFKSYSDSLFNEDVIRRTTQLEMQYQFDTRMKQREVEQLKQKRRNLIFVSVTSGLFLLLLILVLLLKLEKNKKKKVELERKSLKDELDFRNKELTTFVINNLRRNELILSISEKLRNLGEIENVQNRKLISDIVSELKSDPSKMEWKEFEIRFQNVYTGFYRDLSAKYPDLTPNDLRLCAFLRLNMSTKDIAAITYQSNNTIDVARFRLRKKLDLTKEDNLVTFLQQFQ